MDEEKQAEFPLDIAREIQEALKPLTYVVTAFIDDYGVYTVKLIKRGIYSDSHRQDKSADSPKEAQG
jgi:hypothetical protein